ncbi:TetR family transcriptional regulator [Neobacillus piezotolerans]|uniref:TetR family transcriptional regulator n=1 Tax=Neobacillus piezotolerans TaxID=2259171 RepID=A0A3D8GQJ9_9BACI|nr:TetR/AcrR family transcriptional regulator [Neobacillus piezotolerans]RDU36764.1 TetR family transcriptional regulator [Neobacillus piezotolerans]
MSPRPKTSLDMETIIRTAADLADRKGFGDVTLANLAKELNIKSPSLYNHVDGLPGLKKQLAIYGINNLYQALEDAKENFSKKDVVLALSIGYVGFARKHPGVYEATFNAPDPSDSEVQDAGSKIVGLVLDSLGAFGLEKEEALHAVRGLRSLIHGFCSLEQKGGFGLNLSLNESLSFMVEAFMAGIAARRC